MTRVEALPTWVDLSPDIRLVDLGAALADPALSAADRAVYLAAPPAQQPSTRSV